MAVKLLFCKPAQISKEVKKILTKFLIQAVQVEKREAEGEGGKDNTSNREKGEEAALEKEEKEREKEKEKEKEKEEKKEEKIEKQEEEKEEKKEEEAGPEGVCEEEKEQKATEEEAKAPRAPRRPKTMQIKVTLLDDTVFECELDVSSFLMQYDSYWSEEHEISTG